MNSEHPTPWELVSDEDRGYMVLDANGFLVEDFINFGTIPIPMLQRIIRAVNGEEAHRNSMEFLSGMLNEWERANRGQCFSVDFYNEAAKSVSESEKALDVK